MAARPHSDTLLRGAGSLSPRMAWSLASHEKTAHTIRQTRPVCGISKQAIPLRQEEPAKDRDFTELDGFSVL